MGRTRHPVKKRDYKMNECYMNEIMNPNKRLKLQ